MPHLYVINEVWLSPEIDRSAHGTLGPGDEVDVALRTRDTPPVAEPIRSGD